MQETQEMWVWSLGWEYPLEEGVVIHSSILAWRIPWTEEPGGLNSVGSQRIRHNWSDWACSHTSIWAPYLSAAAAAAAAKSLQSCQTLCDPRDGSPPGSCHPWDSPGKNNGVGCHFLFQCMKVKSISEVTQSCLTLCDPTDCSPPGSSIHGIFQARALEWGASAFSALFVCSYSYLLIPRLSHLLTTDLTTTRC